MKPESETYVRIFCAALQGILANPKLNDDWEHNMTDLQCVRANILAAINLTNTAMKEFSNEGVI